MQRWDWAELDAELAAQLNGLCHIFAIKRDRDSIPVEDVSSRICASSAALGEALTVFAHLAIWLWFDPSLPISRENPRQQFEVFTRGRFTARGPARPKASVRKNAPTLKPACAAVSAITARSSAVQRTAINFSLASVTRFRPRHGARFLAAVGAGDSVNRCASCFGPLTRP